jgi:hypothetical protein
MPRESDPFEGDAVVDPPPQLTEGEKAVFSACVQFDMAVPATTLVPMLVFVLTP